MIFIDKTTVVACTIASLILACVFVAARLYVRWRTKTFGIDDWFCLLGLVIGAGDHAVILWGAFAGVLGSWLPDPRKDYTADGAHYNTKNLISDVVCIIEPLTMACVKISLLFFYRRIFIGKMVHWIIWIVVGITMVWGIFFSLFYVPVFCWAFAGIQHEGRCNIDGENMEFAYGVMDVGVDFIILIIPIVMVFPMRIRWKRKLSILFTLLLGSLAIALAFIRALYLCAYMPIMPHDQVQYVTMLQFIPAVQIGIGLVAICLPILGTTILGATRICLGYIFPSMARIPEDSPSSPAARQPKPKNGQPTTLGSIDTQNLEAFARGRVRGDEERALMASSVSNEKSVGTVTTNSLP